jgi:transcriptional regulator with XRE-family HTH domain
LGNKDELASRIGRRLKGLRRKLGLTIKRLAQQTGLSPPLFSRIENGLLTPSLQTLQLISTALGVDIGYFFQEEEEKGYVISRSGSRRVASVDRGAKGRATFKIEFLAEGMENPFMEPVIVTELATRPEEFEPVTHAGQEFVYVIEGKVELTLGEKKFALRKGDAAYFNGDIPHRGLTLSTKPARTLNVHMVPGKRSGTFEPREGV